MESFRVIALLILLVVVVVVGFVGPEDRLER